MGQGGPIHAKINRPGPAELRGKTRGVFVGPTYYTTYEAPLKGSAYPLRDIDER